MSEDWQKFEELACNVQRDLSPNADVTHNEKIRGKTGILNQCDVVIRSKIGIIEFLGVIECKDHAKKIGVEIIRGFKSKLEDIGAMKGIMVSSEGFTRDAYIYAKNHEIDTYLLVDAKSIKWNKHALIPLVLCEVNLSSCECINYRNTDGEQISLSDESGHSANNYYYWDNRTSAYIQLKKLSENLWDEMAPAKNYKNGKIYYKSAPHQYELCHGGNSRTPVTIEIYLKSTDIYHYGSVSVEDGQGYLNMKTKQFHSKQFACSPLDWQDALKKWPSTQSSENIPFQPIMWLWIVRYFSERENHAKQFIQMGGGIR